MTSDPQDAAPAAVVRPRGPGRPAPAGFSRPAECRPLESRTQARGLPSVRRAASEVARGGDPQAARERIIGAAIAGAEVAFGSFDRSVAGGLAAGPAAPEILGVIASWIARAAEARSVRTPAGEVLLTAADAELGAALVADAVAWRVHTRRRDRISDLEALGRLLRGEE